MNTFRTTISKLTFAGGLALAGVTATAVVATPAVVLAAPPHGEEGGHGEGEHAAGGEHGEGGHDGAHGEHHPTGMAPFFHWGSAEDPRTGFGWILLNFAVLAYLVNMLLFKNLRVMHADKRSSIKDDLDKATVAREEAESLMGEYRAKLDKLDEEIDSVVAKAKERAQADYDKLLAEARDEAEKIKAQAKASAEREAERRLKSLEAEIVDKALETAEATLRAQFGAADQRKSIDAYVTEVGQADLGSLT